MKNQEIALWLEQVSQQNQGQIIIVQTIRNAIMSASILASVTLIALMGALATGHTQISRLLITAIGLLLMSATCSAISISYLARLSFQTQFAHVLLNVSAQRLRLALNYIRASAWLFISSLIVAALDVWR